MKARIRLSMCLYAAQCIVLIQAVNLSENEIDQAEASFGNHPNPKMPASEMPLEVDILKLMKVSHKDQGVSAVEGPIANFPAYKFRLPYGNVPMIDAAAVTEAINKTNGFTVIFLYRQQKNNLGTLISINSPGRLTPWFQLTSNSKTGILTLKYRLQNSTKLNQKDWELPRHHRKAPLAAWIWLSLSMDLQEDLIRLDLDCSPSKFDNVPSLQCFKSMAWIWLSLSMDLQEDLIRLDLDCSPSKFETVSSRKNVHPKLAIASDALVYFRQEPGRKKKFLGSMQVAKILPYVTHERLWNCYEISSHLAPEFQKPIVQE